MDIVGMVLTLMAAAVVVVVVMGLTGTGVGVGVAVGAAVGVVDGATLTSVVDVGHTYVTEMQQTLPVDYSHLW